MPGSVNQLGSRARASCGATSHGNEMMKAAVIDVATDFDPRTSAKPGSLPPTNATVRVISPAICGKDPHMRRGIFAGGLTFCPAVEVHG